MKITYSHPPYAEVTADDGRWWSVANLNTGYFITNAHGRIVKNDGALGRKLIAVVEKSLEEQP